MALSRKLSKNWLKDKFFYLIPIMASGLMISGAILLGIGFASTTIAASLLGAGVFLAISYLMVYFHDYRKTIATALQTSTTNCTYNGVSNAATGRFGNSPKYQPANANPHTGLPDSSLDDDNSDDDLHDQRDSTRLDLWGHHRRGITR